ncbi:hypothetical protein [Desulfolithobacter sp.]
MKKLRLQQTCTTTLFVVVFLLCTHFVPTAFGAVVAEKTPNDVYAQVQLLANRVKQLRILNNINSPWPDVSPEKGREPRHVLQKALEILGKINQFRVNILKTGEISVPRFPGRDITPNEVYSAVVRLRRELDLLIPIARPSDEDQNLTEFHGKTPSDVYAALSEISLALDETLGLRGFTPSDVYVQSLRILDLVTFLRTTQNLHTKIPKPPRTSGKLPNHALASVYELLQKIRHAEKNLWIKPVTVPEVPRRVITPGDVFDATNVVLAELQRIKYRLGLERDFKDPRPEPGRTPDDVIQNIKWASMLLPDFALERPLRQFDRKALKKTPNHVYSVTDHILSRLREYRRRRGIQAPPRKAEIIYGLQPQHVYEKGLEILEKVDVVRRSYGLGPIAVQRYPLRVITPSEVFDLALRLDEELDILFRQDGMPSDLWLTSSKVAEFDDKTPSDVFLNMRRISLLLDTILGSEGFTPSHVFREAVSVRDNIMIIARALGEPCIDLSNDKDPLRPEIQPRDVYFKAREVMGLVLEAKRRAGMFGVRDISIPPGKPVTPTDVFNQVRIIDAELTELKVFLGISSAAERPDFQEGKIPAQVFRVLEQAEEELRIILHKKQASAGVNGKP